MTTNRVTAVAQSLLDQLGILEPDEIDIELIAYSQGAIVEYAELCGCEASILGCGNSAFINVNKNSRIERQRFSIAHELGHWCLDRGTIAAHSVTGETFLKKWNRRDPEVRANRFASDLLMPPKMIKPRCQHKEISLRAVRELAEEFSTSLTATAIKLVETCDRPSMVIMTNRTRVLWFVRNEIVPRQFFVSTPGSRGSLAFSLFANCNRATELTESVAASEWFALEDSSYYSIIESSVLVSDDEALTILWWDDESQIINFDNKEDEEEID